MNTDTTSNGIGQKEREHIERVIVIDFMASAVNHLRSTATGNSLPKVLKY